MEFSINGGLKLQLDAPLQLSASDVKISKAGQKFASFKALTVTFDWRPLLERQLIVDDITLQSADMYLQQDEQGELLLPEIEPQQPAVAKAEKNSDEPLPLHDVRVIQLQILDANLLLQQTGETAKQIAQIKNLDFTLDNLQLVKGAEIIVADWPNYLSQVALQAQLTIESLSYEKYQLRDVQAQTHNKGQLLLTDLSLKSLGAVLKSDLEYDWQQDAQTVASKLTVRGLELAQLAQLLELEQTLQGALDVDWHGGSKLNSADDWLAALKGELAVRGEQLEIQGFNLNKLLDNLVKSQELDLVDLGGLALAGPIGLMLTKGGDYGSIIQAAAEGETHIRQLNMEWDIAKQSAHFKDVAVATDANRMALTGEFGLVGYTFDPVNLYLLDQQGCKIFKQQIKGSVQEPEVSAMAFAAKSLLNPLVSIAEKSLEAVTECAPVYIGKVAAPPNKKALNETAEKQSVPVEKEISN